jgi:hypothetical protein
LGAAFSDLEILFIFVSGENGERWAGAGGEVAYGLLPFMDSLEGLDG